MNRCEWDGDCDNCPADDCVATFSQASKFYVREENQTRQRYGRETVRAYAIQMRKNEYWWREAKWI